MVPNNTYGWGRINAFAAVKKGLLSRRPTAQTVDNQQFVKVSPNPFTHDIHVDTEGVVGENTVTIFTINGFIIFEKTSMFAASNRLTISLSGLPTGIYFYQIHNKNVTLSGKLVKIG